MTTEEIIKAEKPIYSFNWVDTEKNKIYLVYEFSIGEVFFSALVNCDEDITLSECLITDLEEIEKCKRNYEFFKENRKKK